MDKWCYVKDGEIKYIGRLPYSFDGQAGLTTKSKKELAKLGWLPLENEIVTAKPWQTVVDDGYEIMKTKVVKKYKLVDKQLDQFKQERIKLIKQNASNEILSRYPEYKQINAALGIYDTKKQQEIIDAINKVRAEVDEKEQEILNATTYEEVDAVYLPIVALLPPERVDEKGHIIPLEGDII